MPDRANRIIRAMPVKTTNVSSEFLASNPRCNGAILPRSFAGHGMPCPYSVRE